MEMDFLQLLAHKSNYGSVRNTKNIKYVVLHYTANNGDTARNNCVYFQRPNLNTSAHYFVDENSIYLSVPVNYVAYHCGAKKYNHKECRNDNSIGIELCSRIDSKGNYYFKDETVDNAIKLCKYLETKYKIEGYLRHYDVTGKMCPRPFISNTILWNNVLRRLGVKNGD